LETASGRRIPRRSFRLLSILTVAALLVWIGLIVLAPYLVSVDSAWGGFLYAVFSPTCHQLESRCLRLFGYPLAVCARCSGIYLGFLAGSLILAVSRPRSRLVLPPTRILAAATLPIGLDTLGNLLALWDTPSALRLGLGIAWGLTLPFYFIPAVADALSGLRRYRDQGA
jgi:uncharacterized membrane protein